MANEIADKKKHIVIVGGGPVGALNACYLSRRGFKVDLYEGRNDIRQEENATGRSINLALSCRGIAALNHVGLDKRVMALGIPMKARMIHLPNGELYSVPYGKTGQHLLSIDRLQLNKDLLTVASSQPNVSIHFNTKLINCDIKKAKATFSKKDGTEIRTTSDAIFGCDGAFSAVRRQMQRGVFNYSQEYIQHGYKELTIPSTKNGEFAMATNYLHIWPRHEFMMIGLPNQDKSFTVTLFMPFTKFNALTKGDEVVEFFKEVFPDSLPLIGEELLREDFFKLPALSLVSVKCSPYHCGNTVVLFGDAAHAVVPFFGQGLNGSLEDVLVFDGIMEEHENDFDKVLPEYTKVRCKDGQALADLSKQNYIEMRSSVVSLWFLFRKKVDNILTTVLPSMFVPKYSMVAFTRTPYHQVILQSKRNDKIINTALLVFALLMLGACLCLFISYKDGSVTDSKTEL
ncbi:kynurenine 3-monooxygenase-like [Clavelina lepadiformis]|uniref:kynurenine 3-monooxygenase-like n=1 Tax=Clavelina lepadiformis TaxID=159417 RepID=UPI0040424594